MGFSTHVPDEEIKLHGNLKALHGSSGSGVSKPEAWLKEN
jgi:hypothetical protein